MCQSAVACTTSTACVARHACNECASAADGASHPLHEGEARRHAATRCDRAVGLMCTATGAICMLQREARLWRACVHSNASRAFTMSMARFNELSAGLPSCWSRLMPRATSEPRLRPPGPQWSSQHDRAPAKEIVPPRASYDIDPPLPGWVELQLVRGTASPRRPTPPQAAFWPRSGIAESRGAVPLPPNTLRAN